MKREQSFCIHIHIQASTSFFIYSDPANDFDCSTRPFLDFCIKILIRVHDVPSRVLAAPVVIVVYIQSPFLPGPLSLALLASLVGCCPFLSGNVYQNSKLSMLCLPWFWPHPRKDVGAWEVSASPESLLYLYEHWTIEHYICYCSFSIQSLCNVHLNSKLSMLCLPRFWSHPRKNVGTEAGSAFLESLL